VHGTATLAVTAIVTSGTSHLQDNHIKVRDQVNFVDVDGNDTLKRRC
jgi:hypothetical protein